MAAHKTFADYEKQIQNLDKLSDGSRFQQMVCLIDLHQDHTSLWRPVLEDLQLKTWDDLLRAKSWCTPSRYRNFRKGLGILGHQLAKTLGVEATALLATYEKAQRAVAVKAATGWIQDQKVVPRYQKIAEVIKHKFPGRPDRGHRVKTLLQHIAAQDALIRKLGGTPKQVPKK